jgi:hypothetical protein
MGATRAERIVERLQRFLRQVDIANIVVGEADEPECGASTLRRQAAVEFPRLIRKIHFS